MEKSLKDRKLNKLIISFLKYLGTALIIVGSFFYGRFHESYNKTVEEEEIVIKVTKESVNLAIDESENLIIIDKETGHYTVYQDSLGYYIFNLYTKSIWSQHDKK